VKGVILSNLGKVEGSEEQPAYVIATQKIYVKLRGF
jgi:hypothetical protein